MRKQAVFFVPVIILFLLFAGITGAFAEKSPLDLQGDPVVDAPAFSFPSAVVGGFDPVLNLKNKVENENVEYSLFVYSGELTTLPTGRVEYVYDKRDLQKGSNTLAGFGCEVDYGAYTVFVLAIDTEEWNTLNYSSQVFYVLKNDTRPEPPKVAADQNEVPAGAGFSCTVQTHGAERIKSKTTCNVSNGNFIQYDWIDGVSAATGDQTVWEGRVTDEIDYYVGSIFHCRFAVQINGVWSTFSDPVDIRMTEMIQLDEVVIHAPEVHCAGEDLVFCVDEVPDAKWYHYSAVDDYGITLGEGRCYPATDIVIPGNTITAGKIRITVTVSAPYGYSDSTGEIYVTVVRDLTKIHDFVARCYRIILSREPDDGGLNTWTNELASGRKAASEIIDRFVNSPEFTGKDYSNEEKVDILYQTMLGRNADPAGKENWVQKLENGQTLAHIINGFCRSAEFTGICDSYGITPGSVTIPDDPDKPTTPDEKIKAFVTRCYSIILGRNPDEGGLNTWFNELKSGRKAAAEIIDRFVNSPEFLGKNYSKEEQVEILYKTMLNRGSDPAGKANWVAKLDAGQTLAHVINGFCRSPEFVGICESYGITPGSVTINALARNMDEPVSRTVVDKEENEETASAAREIVLADEQAEDELDTAVMVVYYNAEKVQAFVKKCYQDILGRSETEEAIGKWAEQILNGAKTPDQIIRGFLFSGEFGNKEKSNEELVKILYKVYMNRDADPEGLATWTAKLDGGMTLKELADAFAKTDEYRKMVQGLEIPPLALLGRDDTGDVKALED